MFNNMLTNCVSIVSDTFNIEFDKKQAYNLSLPPTVYELLWRYEYITFKSTINEEGQPGAQEADSPMKISNLSKALDNSEEARTAMS